MTRAPRPTNRLVAGLLAPLVLALLTTLGAAPAVAADPVAGNRLTAVSFDQTEAGPQVKIVTEKPVGYRYTVYDSFDPVRVVLDFPGMDVSGVQPLLKVDNPIVNEIRLTSFDLTSGKLGRLEILLTGAANYNVALKDTEFKLIFSGQNGAASVAAPVTAPAAAAPTVAAEPAPSPAEPPTAPPGDAGATAAVAAPPAAPAAEAAPATPPAPAGPAKSITSVQLSGGTAQILLDGQIEKYQHFTLKSPARLVVDLYNVKPQFKERTLPASQGFSKVRVGLSGNKTRLVFDASGKLPKHSVAKHPAGIEVVWGKAATDVVATTATPATTATAPAGTTQEPVKPSGPVTVENVEFQVDDQTTLIKITLSAPGEFTPPAAEGKLVRFAVKRASIARSLRRTLDANAFPSAVKQVTPYLASEQGRQEVRFAVELKGPAPYTLTQEGNQLLFKVENRDFAEPAPPATDQLAVTPPAATAPSPAEPETTAAATSTPAAPSAEKVAAPTPAAEASREAAEVPATEPVKTRGYKGQKISLVFDNADIRNILQLIGEVSELNIIAGDEVKGTITLRLIDVPWDQALDLIMETKGLDMLREGNVIRVLPKEQIRAMRQEELKARQEELKAIKEETISEPPRTETFQINYTSLGNISGPVKGLLTKDGKVVEDNRNKQLIVTDVPSTLKAARELIEKLDTPEKQVMIEARIVEANASFSRDLGVKWGLSYANDSSGAGQPSQAAIGLGGSFLISPPTAGSVLSGAGLGSGITFGQLGISNTILDLRISALEASGHGKVVSTPRVTTLNGGEATISQGTKIPYQSSGSEGPKTEFVDANLELKVTPVINPDGSVILDISASNSSIGSTVSTGTGAAPAIDTKEAKTKVLIKNGETTVIGGIFVENETNSEAGVPILRHIPLLGHLFKSTSATRSRAELLIFITPRILN